MTPTADEAIELISRLPPPEREKVRSWISRSNGVNSANEIAETNDRFARSMAWIEEHRSEFVGMWVALDGDQLLASGRDGKAVRAEAAHKSASAPLMHLVTMSEIEPFTSLD